MARRVIKQTTVNPTDYYEVMPGDAVYRQTVASDGADRDRDITTAVLVVVALVTLLIISLIVVRGFGSSRGGPSLNTPTPNTPTQNAPGPSMPTTTK